MIDPTHKSTNKAYLDVIYPLARQYRDSFIFATVDGVKYNKYISNFGLKIELADTKLSLPTIVVLTESDYFISPPSGHPLSASLIPQFLADVASGSISVSGTNAWYNPVRYLKLVEKYLNALPMWQLVIVIIIFVLAFFACMFGLCFYGLDAAESSDTTTTTPSASPRTKKNNNNNNNNEDEEEEDENNSSDAQLRPRKQNDSASSASSSSTTSSSSSKDE